MKCVLDREEDGEMKKEGWREGWRKRGEGEMRIDK